MTDDVSNPTPDPKTAPKEPLQELAEQFREYIKGHHNASGWWNDPSAYDWMRWLDKFARTHNIPWRPL